MALSYIKLPIMGECVRVNGYIIWDDNSAEASVIDPGGQCEMICKRINDMQLKLKYIILTHGHFDHISAVADLMREYPASICMNRNDEEFICDSEKNAANFAKSSAVKQFSVDRYIEEGDTLPLGDEKLMIISTPGHTPGQISIYYPGHIFCGDTILKGGCGRMDLYGADFELCKKSILEKLLTLPENTAIHCGHNDDSSVEYELKNNIIFNH